MSILKSYIDKLLKTNRIGKLIKLVNDNRFEWSVDTYEYILRNNHRYNRYTKFYRIYCYFLQDNQLCRDHLFVTKSYKVLSSIEERRIIHYNNDEDLSGIRSLKYKYLLSKEMRYGNRILKYITLSNIYFVLADDSIFRKLKIYTNILNRSNRWTKSYAKHRKNVIIDKVDTHRLLFDYYYL